MLSFERTCEPPSFDFKAKVLLYKDIIGFQSFQNLYMFNDITNYLLMSLS